MGRLKSFLKFLLKTVKWCFIVFFVFLASLFFREQRLPGWLVEKLTDAYLPPELIVSADSVSFSFLNGVRARNLRVYDSVGKATLKPTAVASVLAVLPFQRRVVIHGLSLPRLPEIGDGRGDGGLRPKCFSSHQPTDSNQSDWPEIAPTEIVLLHPEVLGVKAEKADAKILVDSQELRVEDIRLIWPDTEERIALDGALSINRATGKLAGSIRGGVKPHHLLPLFETIDLECANPYVGAFTELPSAARAHCVIAADLRRCEVSVDVDLELDMGKYNGVPMSHVRGRVRNQYHPDAAEPVCRTEVTVAEALDSKGRALSGSVTVDCTNALNVVTVKAKSGMLVADLLKIGGFDGEYVGEEVYGNTQGEFTFVIPDDMPDDCSTLSGTGKIDIRDGQIMRMKGFNGLLSLLADKVPGVSWFTDSTQYSSSYTIRDGLLSTDDIYIEGTVFSIKMYGTYDIPRDKIDFRSRVQFMKKDTILSKVVHPLTWPFTKLLLEYRLTGTSDDPKWSYISILDRVLEVTE